jgi:uncharacterized protein (DUF169 family)
MLNMKAINEALNTYIRPQSYPLAVRACTADEELPQDVCLPKKKLGISITLCQGLAMARRYRWAVAVDKEDQACPHGHVVLGFVRSERYLDGSLAEKAGLETRQQFANRARHLTFLEFSRYKCLLAAPLEMTTFDPHFILVYGNPAQVARLVMGATFQSGSPLNLTAGGGIACSLLAKTILTDECQVILAGAGDRYYALTQDHEMAFTIPVSKIEATIEGLEMSTKTMGHRYPTPSFLRFNVPIPESYKKLSELLLCEK